jgi:predicted dehydrogenase
LLSTARINRALIPPLKSSARNQLAAVASRSLANAGAYAREWEIPGAYGSYEDLLADPEIDVVYNPLPNSLHAEWTIKAARAGKHVLCEKPLALTLAEVDAISAAAAQAGVVVAEAFMYRHHPQTLKVKELVQAGEIGEIWLVRGSFTFSISNPNDVRLNPALGGGSIWDVGCYPISYARYILGREPEAVFGCRVTGESGVDEAFAGQLQFAGNAFAQFDSGFRSPVRTHLEIVGRSGSIMVPTPFKPGRQEKLMLTRDSETRTIGIPGQELYLGEVEDLADAVLLGNPQRISLADSRGNVATILALLESAERGVPVSL